MPLEFSQNNDGNKGKKGNSADFTRRIQKILGGQIVQRGLPSSDIGLKRRDPVEVEKTPLWQLMRAKFEVSKLNHQYDLEKENYKNLQGQLSAKKALLAYLKGQSSEFEAAEWSRLTDLHNKYKLLMNDQIHQSAEKAIRYGIDRTELQKKISEDRFTMVSEEEQRRHQTRLKEPGQDPVEAQKRYESAMDEARNRYGQEQENCKAEIAALEKWSKEEQERYQSCIEDSPNQTHMGNLDRISADELEEYQNWMTEQGDRFMKEFKNLGAKIKQLEQKLHEKKERMKMLTKILPEMNLEETQDKEVQIASSSEEIQDKEVQIASSPKETQDKEVQVVFSPEEYRGKMAVHHREQVSKSELRELFEQYDREKKNHEEEKKNHEELKGQLLRKPKLRELFEQYDREKKNREKLQCQLDARNALFDYLKGQSGEFGADDWSRRTDLHNKYKLLIHAEIHQSVEKEIGYGIDITELQKKDSEDQFAVVSEEARRRHQARLEEPGQDPVEAQKRYESAMDKARNRYGQEQESYQDRIASLKEKFEKEQKVYDTIQTKRSELGLDPISGDELKEYQNWMTEQRNRVLEKVNTEERDLVAQIKQLEQQQYDMDIKQELDEKNKRVGALTRILQKVNWEEIQDKEVQVAVSPGYFDSFEDGWRSVVKQLLKMKQEGRGSKVPNYTVNHLWKVMPDRAGPALEGMEALGLEVPWEYFALLAGGSSLAEESSMEEEPSHGLQQHEEGADNGISPEEQHKEQAGRRRKRPLSDQSDPESEQNLQPDKKKRKKK